MACVDTHHVGGFLDTRGGVEKAGPVQGDVAGPFGGRLVDSGSGGESSTYPMAYSCDGAA